MTFTHLAKAVAVHGGQSAQKDDELSVPECEKYIREHCADLIEIPSDKTPVSIANPIVREFFRNYQPTIDMNSTESYSSIESHAHILAACLRHILKTSDIQTLGPRLLCTDWTFELYASTFWPFHLMQIGREFENFPDLANTVHEFFGRRSTEHGFKFKSWTEKWIPVTDALGLAEEPGKDKNNFAVRIPQAYRLLVSSLASPADPFFAACILGAPSVIQDSSLTPAGMSEIRNTRGEPGAFLAIENESVRNLDALLNLGVDFTKPGCDGNTALHWAAMKASSRVLKHLWKQKKITNASPIINDYGATVLHCAAGSARQPLEKIGLLTDLKLNLDRPDFENKTPLHYAVQNPKVTSAIIAKFLVLNADFKVKDRTNSTVLHYAIRNREATSKSIEKICSSDVDVNEIDDNKKTALGYLVEDHHSATRVKELVPILLQCKASTKTSPGEESILHLAVKNPVLSRKTFRTLLSHEECNDVVDTEGRTLLHFALLCYKGSAETASSRERLKTILEILLKEEDIDVNEVDKKGRTALHYLAAIPTLPSGIRKVLLTKVTNREAVDHNKETALHILLRENAYANTANRDAVRSFIESSSDLEITNDHGETALQLAVRNKNTWRSILLLWAEKSSAIDAKDDKGRSALHYAARLRGLIFNKHLLEHGANHRVLDGEGASALHHAAASVRGESADIIKLLVIEHGSDVDLKDNLGRTPILYAARSGTLRGLLELEKQNGKSEVVDNEGDTILHHATRNITHGPAILESLIDRGSFDIDAKNKLGETSFLCAVREGLVEAVEILIKRKANIESRSEGGNSALHLALKRSSQPERVVKLLLAECIDPGIESDSKETALHIALKSRDDPSFTAACALLDAVGSKANDGRNLVARTIDVEGADGRTALQRAAELGWLKAVETLLSHGASVTIGDKDGMTPACLAARSGQAMVVKALVENHRSATQSGPRDGRTPLHFAAENDHRNVARILLEAQADPNAPDSRKQAPLHSAAISGSVGTLRLLLQYGSEVSQKDENGRTPLQGAVQHGHEAIINALLTQGADAEGLATFAQEHSSKSSTGSDTSPAAMQDVYIQSLLPSSRIRDLHNAIRDGSLTRVKAVLSHPLVHAPTIVNAKEPDSRWTALYLAANKEKLDILKLLLDQFDADPNIRCGKERNTALMTGRLHVAKALIAAGKKRVNLNVEDRNGQTVLFLGHSRKPKWLLDMKDELDWKFDVNKRDKFGRTALMLAAKYGNAELVRGLLELQKKSGDGLGESNNGDGDGGRGAEEKGSGVIVTIDIKAEDKKHRTALSWAQEIGNKEIETMLLQAMGEEGKGSQ